MGCERRAWSAFFGSFKMSLSARMQTDADASFNACSRVEMAGDGDGMLCGVLQSADRAVDPIVRHHLLMHTETRQCVFIESYVGSGYSHASANA